MQIDKIRDQRNSSIELLRIISIVGVVILHYNNINWGRGFNYVNENSINSNAMHLLECISIVSVNVFILISGYFLIKSEKRSLVKPIRLIVQVIFFVTTFYVITIIKDKSVFSISGLIRIIPSTLWYLSVYIALYLVSPFINKLLNSISNENRKLLLLLMFILFSVEPTLVDLLNSVSGESYNYLSFISLMGSDAGYSIVNFILVYIIGALIRQNEESLIQIRVIRLILYYLLSLLMNFLFYLLIGDCALNYSNPLVVIQSALVFMIALRIRMKNNRIINLLSKAAFTAYIIHVFFFDYFDIQAYVNRPLLIYLSHTFATALIIYAVSWILYMIYSCIEAPVLKVLNKISDSCNYRID